MNRTYRRCQIGGFTLIELLTVVAIIALLIGILVPSFSAARNQARRAATSGFIAAIGKAAEMFYGDNDHYPLSHGLVRSSPFQRGNAPLWGAQWIAMQLSGPDLQGYVKPVLSNDTNNDGKINRRDWHEWYSREPRRKRVYPRLGPYISPEGDNVSTPRRLIEMGVIESFDRDAFDGCGRSRGPQARPDGRSWPGCDQPVYLDAFGRPILYYAANPGARYAFTTGTRAGDLEVGRYDQYDNAGFTGSKGRHGLWADVFGRLNGVRFDGQADEDPLHPLGVFQTGGYDPRDRTRLPPPETFAAFFMDRSVFESRRKGKQGKVWPHNADTFILISAGRDGRYGTSDDVANFQPDGG